MTTLVPKYDLGVTGAINRAFNLKLNESPSVKDFGAVGDNSTDDTAAIQAAINYVSANNAGGELFIPPGKYLCTSSLVIRAPITLRGVSPELTSNLDSGLGGGSWFNLAHTAAGFSVTNTAGFFAGVNFFSLGTFRTNNPAFGPGWVPASNDFDFLITGITDVTFDDILMYNPTNGIRQTGGGGRINFYNVRGQPLTNGIVIESAFDVCRFDQIHFWPFWTSSSYVTAYTQANLNAIQLIRCDNPIMSNIFVIFANIGLRISTGALGTTHKLKLTNADYDSCQYGIYIDAAVEGSTGQITNMAFQGPGTTGSPTSIALAILGTNNLYDFANLKINVCYRSAIQLLATGNFFRIVNLIIQQFDMAGSGAAAVDVAVANDMYIIGQPKIEGSGGGPKYTGAGVISVDEWRTFTPVVTAQTGTVTTFGASLGQYKRIGNTMAVIAKFAITTNGTAAGSLKLALPVGTASTDTIGVGREILATGNMLQTVVLFGTTYAGITKYDNSYPGADNTTFDVTFTYLV